MCVRQHFLVYSILINIYFDQFRDFATLLYKYIYTNRQLKLIIIKEMDVPDVHTNIHDLFMRNEFILPPSV